MILEITTAIAGRSAGDAWGMRSSLRQRRCCMR
jgi:hypothetical protein